MTCEDKGRNQGDVPASQGMQRFPGNHQKLGDKHGTDCPHNLQKEPTLSTS